MTIVATVDLADLQAKAGVATTGGGSWLPMTDVIRMAAQVDNFLLIFDDAQPCALYKGRSTRLATPAQRLVLDALERGCSHPAVPCRPAGARPTTPKKTGPPAGRRTSTN